MAEHTPIPAGAYERLARQLRADMQRKQFLEQMQAVRNAEDMVGRHSVGPDTRRQVHPDLISNALLAGTLGGAMSASGLPSVGLRAGLIGGGLTDATLNAGNPEGGAEISGALAAAGALGRHSIPAALAALGASSSEASGMPFHSWMKRLNALNKVEPTAMYVNPTNAELLGMMRDARETYPTSPTVRLLRDQRSNDVYGVEGSSILHDDMRKHLKLKYEFSPGSQGSTLPELDTELHFLKSLPRLAGGGAIKRLGKAAMSAFDELRPSSVAPQGALSVVKNKGGNWLSGSVEDALGGLKYEDPPVKGAIRTAPEVYNNGASERVVWKSPEGQVVQINEGPVGHWSRQADPLDQWIDNQLTKYVKTRMASPDDEVRKLAEQGVLHVDPAQLHAPIGLHSGVTRQEFGQSPVAKRWEFASDSFIAPETAGLFKVTRGQDGTTTLSRNPWLADLPNEATVYDLGARAHPDNLGFNHLIDELSNALNPNSGLPAHLQLTPEAVKQMSMEKAVRRVADINAHRAAVQAAANQELANKAMVVREYTDPALPNPKGLRWVELKAGDLPEDWTKGEGGHKYWRDAEGNVQTLHPGEAELERQLKYEGDTMGHCVGGYCPDVLEGRSRIFSLRDAKGEPHVTVEVSPERKMREADFEEIDDIVGLNSDLEKKMYAAVGDEPSTTKMLNWLADNAPGIRGARAARLLEDVRAQPPRIVQIKGKQNRKPNDEYLPFVQDFVRNHPEGGKWGEVGDLHNTGLTNIGGRYFNEQELRKAYDAAGYSIPFESLGMDYMDMIARKNLQADKADAAFLQALGFEFKPIQKASGGSVQKPTPTDNFQAIIAALEQELTHA